MGRRAGIANEAALDVSRIRDGGRLRCPAFHVDLPRSAGYAITQSNGHCAAAADAIVDIRVKGSRRLLAVHIRYSGCHSRQPRRDGAKEAESALPLGLYEAARAGSRAHHAKNYHVEI